MLPVVIFRGLLALKRIKQFTLVFGKDKFLLLIYYKIKLFAGPPLFFTLERACGVPLEGAKPVRIKLTV